MSIEQQQEGPSQDWVACPVCGETDMRRERDADKNVLIFCVNHECVSNGGHNMNAIALPATPIPTAVVEAAGLLIQVSEGFTNAQIEVEAEERTLGGVSGAAYFLALGARDEAVTKRSNFLQLLAKATSILQMTLDQHTAARRKKPG